jgi:hypothetical protein
VPDRQLSLRDVQVLAPHLEVAIAKGAVGDEVIKIGRGAERQRGGRERLGLLTLAYELKIEGWRLVLSKTPAGAVEPRLPVAAAVRCSGIESTQPADPGPASVRQH